MRLRVFSIVFLWLVTSGVAGAQAPFDPITGQLVVKPVGIPMPDVRGQSLLEAQRRLRDSGLGEPQILEVEAPDAVGQVVRQSPVAGAYVDQVRPLLEIGVESVTVSAMNDPVDHGPAPARARSMWPWVVLLLGSGMMGTLLWLGWKRWGRGMADEAPLLVVMRRRRTRR